MLLLSWISLCIDQVRVQDLDRMHCVWCVVSFIQIKRFFSRIPYHFITDWWFYSLLLRRGATVITMEHLWSEWPYFCPTVRSQSWRLSKIHATCQHFSLPHGLVLFFQSDQSCSDIASLTERAQSLQHSPVSARHQRNPDKLWETSRHLHARLVLDLHFNHLSYLSLFMNLHHSGSLKEVETSDVTWYSSLSSTNWLQTIGSYLNVALRIVDLMNTKRCSVIIKGECHCHGNFLSTVN